MRAQPLLLALLITACDGGEPSDDTDTDPPAVAQCTESYGLPGLDGTIDPATVTPHADTFGAAEAVGGVEVGPDPTQVHLSWPGTDTSTSIGILWQTDTGTLSSLVQWGEGTDLSHTSEGVNLSYGGPDGQSYRVHELKLCGRLKPGTTYSYRVGGEGHWSDTFQFTTPQAPGTFDTFTVAIAGDSRGSYEQWGQLVDRMKAHAPDVFLFSGDMVQLGANESEWQDWWAATGDAFASVPLIPAHGNHEFLAQNYFAHFSLPNNEQWFSNDLGNLTLVSLNDTVAALEILAVDEKDFLDAELTRSTADWKAVMHHRTMVTSSDSHAPAAELAAAWGPVIDAHDVDFVFAGHNHLYERSVPITGGVAADGGTTYFVSGGAGAPLYTDINESTLTAYANAVEHYVIAEFTPTEVVFTTRDLLDNVLETTTFPRGE